MLKAIRALFSPGDDKAQQIYGKLVAASRQPVFYAEMNVPDTVEGRYDMLVIHAVLLFCRLRGDEAERAFAQDVFDAMFKDMDRGLREAGIGDLGVPKRIKKLAQAFYGRAQVYDDALTETNEASLADAIARNVFRVPLAEAPSAHELAHYMRDALAGLREQPFDAIRDGRLKLPPPMEDREDRR